LTFILRVLLRFRRFIEMDVGKEVVWLLQSRVTCKMCASNELIPFANNRVSADIVP
jgi:hypothetical protein